MTRDEIIRLAKEAGFHDPAPADGYMGLAFDYRDGPDSRASLELFAALVAAAERDACAKVCDERAEAWQAAHLAGQRAMQERAAELCEQFSLAVLESEWANGYAVALKDAACGIRALEVKPS